VWRPILAGLATLHEIEEHWTLSDLLDAHEVLDIKADLEAFEYNKIKKQQGNK